MSSAAKKMIRAGSNAMDRETYLFTVEQYHRMLEAGILADGEPYELLEGLLVKKMTINPPHSVTVSLIDDRLRAVLPPQWSVRPGQPITLSDSEPEPDLSVVVAPVTRYLKSHPTPRDIGLVIEVSDTTLVDDRTVKARVYARARLPEYWIVNIPERQIEVYTRPRAGRSPAYLSRRDYADSQAVPLVLRGQAVATLPVTDLLPPVENEDE